MEHDRIWFQQPNMPPDAMMIIEQMVRKQPNQRALLAWLSQCRLKKKKKDQLDNTGSGRHQES